MATTQLNRDRSPRRRHVDEREARQLAEAARQTEWDRPSFAKELYLGQFRLDLIHPQPLARAEPSKPGPMPFWPSLRALCETELDGSVIERESVIPDEYLKALARLGVFGMKIPREYRRTRARPDGVQPGADADRFRAPVARCTGLRTSVHRRARTGQDVRHRGAETRLPPALCARSDHCVLADRTRLRFGPGPLGRHCDADGRRLQRTS